MPINYLSNTNINRKIGEFPEKNIIINIYYANKYIYKYMHYILIHIL